MRKIFYALSAGGTLVGLLAVTRSYMGGDMYVGTDEMFGKTVIITGANRGIGKETAKDLAKRGDFLQNKPIFNVESNIMRK
jgi:hypothetical protein